MATETGSFTENSELATVSVTNYYRTGSKTQPPSVTSTANESKAAVSGSWTRVSSRTPNFHNPNRATRLKPLRFTYTKSRSVNQTGYATSTPTKATSTANNTFFSSIGCFGTSPNIGKSEIDAGIDSAVRDRLVDVCTNKLLGKIKDSSINLGVTYAERAKTANTVANGIKRIATGIRHLKRGDFVSAAEAIGAVASRRGRRRFSREYARDVEQAVAKGWLELNYGWRPILNDIYGACDSLARRERQDMYVTTTHTERFEQSLSYYSETDASGDSVSTVYADGQRSTLVKISCTYWRPSNGTKTLAELGITNPALVAWELVPFSFVADWALPIGGWLNTLDAHLGLKFYSGYRTEFVKRNFTSTRTLRGLDAYGKVQDMVKTGSSEYVSCQRYPLSDFPSARPPRFRNPLSMSNLASAMALLTTIFRK